MNFRLTHNMKNSPILFLAALLFGFTATAQELTCADFRTGRFYIPTNVELEKFTVVSPDSISEINIAIDDSISRYIVVREENTQTEWENGIGNGDPIYDIIEWIDSCTYRLSFDPSRTEMTGDKQWVNDNNGIVVSKTKIEGNCMYYTATMTVNEDIITQNGILCKE